MRRKALVTAGKLFGNRNFILILSLVLGLAIGKPGAYWTQPMVIPLLALVMTISALSISFRQFASVQNVFRIVLYSLLLNYVVLGGITLLLAKWLITGDQLWIGFVVYALVPPATAVVPFSYALKGDVSFSLIGMTGAYLAALIIVPAGIVYFLGANLFNPLSLIATLGELIVIPIFVSRILVRLNVGRYIERWRGSIINWSLFLVIFALISLNRQTFLSDFDALIRTGVIAVITSFLLAYFLEIGAKALRLKYETTISVILLGTIKNYSMAGGILLSLFSERSTIPPAICVFFGIFLVVWLGFHFRKYEQTPRK
ncbi:MAG: bile acid:Na+ symporter, family [Thermoproteota archaeon]|nr:bile acid:Na+ symporter, family [Thermoproteota archaeon]